MPFSPNRRRYRCARRPSAARIVFLPTSVSSLSRFVWSTECRGSNLAIVPPPRLSSFRASARPPSCRPRHPPPAAVSASKTRTPLLVFETANHRPSSLIGPPRALRPGYRLSRRRRGFHLVSPPSRRRQSVAHDRARSHRGVAAVAQAFDPPAPRGRRSTPSTNPGAARPPRRGRPTPSAPADRGLRRPRNAGFGRGLRAAGLRENARSAMRIILRRPSADSAIHVASASEISGRSGRRCPERRRVMSPALPACCPPAPRASAGCRGALASALARAASADHMLPLGRAFGSTGAWRPHERRHASAISLLKPDSFSSRLKLPLRHCTDTRTPGGAGQRQRTCEVQPRFPTDSTGAPSSCVSRRGTPGRARAPRGVGGVARRGPLSIVSPWRSVRGDSAMWLRAVYNDPSCPVGERGPVKLRGSSWRGGVDIAQALASPVGRGTRSRPPHPGLR